MDILEKLVYDAVKPAIEKIDLQTRSDIYVYILNINYQDGDYRQPIVSLGYNTRKQSSEMEKKAASPRDARWNYAFWLPTKHASIGTGKEASIIKNWIKKEGLFYTDQEEENDFDACLEKADDITLCIVDAIISVIKLLHAEKITDQPIIIHAPEYFEDTKDWNTTANGQSLIAEYIEWIDSDEF